jgi:hypothetical protein
VEPLRSLLTHCRLRPAPPYNASMPWRARPELIEARTNVQKLIDALQRGLYSGDAMGSLSVGSPSPDTKRLLASLREALCEIDNTLARLGPDDA